MTKRFFGESKFCILSHCVRVTGKLQNFCIVYIAVAHTLRKKHKNSLWPKKISWNQLFHLVTSFLKTLLSRNIWQNRERIWAIFTLVCGRYFVKSTFYEIVKTFVDFLTDFVDDQLFVYNSISDSLTHFLELSIFFF